MTEDYISKFYEQSLNQPIPYRKGNVWGYSNIWGDILIEPQYQEVGFFNQTMLSDLESYRAVVKQSGRYFIIDNHNNQLSKDYKKIDVIDPYNNENAYFEVYSNTDKSGVFFKNRLIADTQYDEVEPCETHIKVRQSDKYGLMDYEGTLVIPVDFDAIEPIIEEETGILSSWETRLNGVINEVSFVSDTVLSLKDEEIFDDDFFKNMVTLVTKETNIIKRTYKNDKQGVILLKSEKEIKPVYDSINVAQFYEDENLVEVKDYNAMNKKVLFIVEKVAKFGIIDEDSNIILPIEMSSITNNGYDVFKLKKEHQIGRYNHPQKALFFTDYDDISFPEIISLSASEDYMIYKIKKNDGSFDYIGENGIKYYED